jgi:hypothetical protein
MPIVVAAGRGLPDEVTVMATEPPICVAPACREQQSVAPVQDQQAVTPVLTDRPATISPLAAIDPTAFEAPPGMVKVFTISRAALEERVRSGWPGGFESSLFYIGSDDEWDFYFVGHHTFSLFYRVARAGNTQDDRMPLTGDSLAWRQLNRRDAGTNGP